MRAYYLALFSDVAYFLAFCASVNRPCLDLLAELIAVSFQLSSCIGDFVCPLCERKTT